MRDVPHTRPVPVTIASSAPDPSDRPWWHDAACAGTNDPGFTDVGDAGVEHYVAVACWWECPVRQACLDAAMAEEAGRGFRHGYRGGYLPEHRAELALDPLFVPAGTTGALPGERARRVKLGAAEALAFTNLDIPAAAEGEWEHLPAIRALADAGATLSQAAAHVKLATETVRRRLIRDEHDELLAQLGYTVQLPRSLGEVEEALNAGRSPLEVADAFGVTLDALRRQAYRAQRRDLINRLAGRAADQDHRAAS